VDKSDSAFSIAASRFVRESQWPEATVEIPMSQARSLDGIISYLTKKHGGNVHEKGIVTITSKSDEPDPKLAPKNVADVKSESLSRTARTPEPWVCWDFHEMRVRPTHYTIRAWGPKWWVVEGSMDGDSWTEIDRRSDTQELVVLATASFAVSNPGEFRFIRFAKTPADSDVLGLRAVEFFGTLRQ
jgi:hypothetical protein